jgi:hypothetical protein
LKHSISNLLRTDDPEAKSPAVCKCGTAGYESEEVSLVRRKRDGRMEPGVRGVFFCDSPWLCPSCAPRRAAERAERVERVFDAANARGAYLLFVTLTVRHSRKQSLAEVKKLVSEACRKARQGRPWEKAVERFGILGNVVSPEVTWSPANGWHYHIHMGVILQGPDDGDVEVIEATAEKAGEWLVGRYRDYVEKGGGTALRKAQDVQLIWRREDVADYLAKGSAAWEVAAAGATKKGRIGLTPWDLAARASVGDRGAARLFQEYAEVMPGARSCVITKALADKLGLQPEDDSDAPGVADVEVEETVVGSMEPRRWHLILRRGHAADVLKAVSDGHDWQAIDGYIRRALGEEDPARPPPIREHSPPVSYIAARAATEAYQQRGRKGVALQIVLERERVYAREKGMLFVSPDLRAVMQILAS